MWKLKITHGTDVNGFSELLVEIISFFAPYFIKSKFTIVFDTVLNYYQHVIDTNTNGSSIDPLNHNYLNKNENSKVIPYASNSRVTFMSLGNLPYNKEKDELYTSVNGNILNTKKYCFKWKSLRSK